MFSQMKPVLFIFSVATIIPPLLSFHLRSLDFNEVNSTPQMINYIENTNGQISDQQCECIPFFLCNGDDQTFTTSDDDIQNTEDQCLLPNVCCKISNVNSDQMRTLTTLQPNTLPTINTIEMTNSRKIITYQIIVDNIVTELQCKCTKFYQCESKDIIDLSTVYNAQDQCLLPNVCCKKLNTNPLIPTNTVQMGTRTTLQDVSPPICHSPEVINDERLITYMFLVDNCRLIEFQCRCTSVLLCKPENDVSNDVENAFHAIGTCDNFVQEVCCNISANLDTPVVLPDSTENINAIDEDPTDIQCECIPPHQCSPENVIALPITNNEEDQCPEADVCCKIPKSKPSEETSLTEILFNNEGIFTLKKTTSDGKIIQLQCECSSVYFCNHIEIIELPKTSNENDQCSEDKVCCEIKNATMSESNFSSPNNQVAEDTTKVDEPAITSMIETLNEISFNPLPTLVSPNEETETKKIINYDRTTVDGEIIDLKCECLTFQLCNINDIVDIPETNDEKNRCIDADICCKITNTITSGLSNQIPSTITPTTKNINKILSNISPSSNSNTRTDTKKIITYSRSIIDGKFIDLKCECLTAQLCNVNDTIELPVTDNQEDQCSSTHVCCKVSNAKPLKSMISAADRPKEDVKNVSKELPNQNTQNSWFPWDKLGNFHFYGSNFTVNFHVWN